jgi:5-formyltetrahydrofolate cyclo-ligase
MLELRNSQDRKANLEKSDRILANLINMDEYKRAKVIMLYSGKENEVQTEKLIRTALKEKRVVLPITNKEKHILELSEIKDYDRELKIATFNVLEPQREFIRPVKVNILDLIVVPGVAFDYKGNRLGYGFAYYDRLLAMVRRKIPYIGLTFQFQVQDKIPCSPKDIPVDFIVTEEKVIHCQDYK